MEMLPRSVSSSLQIAIRTEVSKLSAERQQQFLDEYKRKAKTLGVAYILWFISWHYVYFGKWVLQILYWITWGGLLVWWFVDLFRIPGIVRNYNQDVAMDALRSLKSIWGPES